MTNQEIHEQIDANNLMIETLITPGTFILNPAIVDLMRENTKLQEQCTHEFENGVCKFCYKKEE